jgi:hypothetical protein
LAAGLDSGISGHHLTNAANPVIVGVGQPGDTLTLFDGTAPVGSGTVAGDGSWAVPTTALADGVHTLAATETDAAGNVSTPSQPLTLTVDGGSNILNGGSGNNVLYGSSGSDAFVFDQPLDPSANVDQIFDFNSVEDRIALNYDIFPGLGGAGPLPATEFSIGPAAAAGSAHINYDAGSGALSYVAHGLGNATQIATLPADLPITAANFQLF